MNETPELTPEQEAALQQQAVEQLFAAPIWLPTRWGVQPTMLNAQDGSSSPGLIIRVQRPTDTVVLVLERDTALTLARDIRKAAQTGPGLVVPPAAGKLVVPG